MRDPDDPTEAPAASLAEAAAATCPRCAKAAWPDAGLPLSLDAYEKAALERALVHTWGDAAQAARMLGIGRSTFYRKAGKHGIHLGNPRSTSASDAQRPSPHRGGVSGVGSNESLG